jgi:hypothetical protein
MVNTPTVVFPTPDGFCTIGLAGARLALLRDFWDAQYIRFMNMVLLEFDRTIRYALTELATAASRKPEFPA